MPTMQTAPYLKNLFKRFEVFLKLRSVFVRKVNMNPPKAPNIFAISGVIPFIESDTNMK